MTSRDTSCNEKRGRTCGQWGVCVSICSSCKDVINKNARGCLFCDERVNYVMQNNLSSAHTEKVGPVAVLCELEL